MKKFSLFLLSLFVLTACGSGEAELPVNEDSVTEDEEVVEVELEEGDEEAYTEVETMNLEEASDGGLTMDVVAMNDSEESCYSVIDGKVYDLTSWISAHPGGAANVLKICGIDGSSAFNGKHGGNAGAVAELDSYYIGDLM